MFDPVLISHIYYNPCHCNKSYRRIFIHGLWGPGMSEQKRIVSPWLLHATGATVYIGTKPRTYHYYVDKWKCTSIICEYQSRCSLIIQISGKDLEIYLYSMKLETKIFTSISIHLLSKAWNSYPLWFYRNIEPSLEYTWYWRNLCSNSQCQ